MSSHDEQVYIRHMLECIAILESCAEKGEDAFENDAIIRGAVLRYLQEIGESSKRLSESSKQSATHIPWRQIAGFRNVLVHEYLGVDMHMTYNVVVKELPPLKTALLLLQKDT